MAADQDHEKSQQLLDRLDERLQNLVSKGNKDAIKLQKMIEDLEDDDDIEDLSEILND